MLIASQSTLFFTVSVCIIVFTGFLVWIMYYLAQIMKQSNEIIIDVRKKMVELEETVNSIKDKVNASTSSIAFIASEIKNILEFVQDRRGAKKGRK